jgi:hypothetical protein
VTSTSKFSFAKKPGPTKARAGWICVGTLDKKPLWYGADQFYFDPFSPNPVPLDEYEIGAMLYQALKDHYQMTHGQMAEMLGVRSRTAEGMAMGRVSAANRLKLARQASTC